jgi:hypothetical protein
MKCETTDISATRTFKNITNETQTHSKKQEYCRLVERHKCN